MKRNFFLSLFVTLLIAGTICGCGKMNALFGENCIADQTFSVELSEYEGEVYFVPYAPSEQNPEFSIKIIKDGTTLSTLNAYVPESLTGASFTSLDAVSFWDINYDSCTDILLIQTYDDTSFVSVYYGFAPNAYESVGIRSQWKCRLRICSI